MSDEKPKPFIVCAAIRNKKGKIIAGARHYDSIMRQQTLDEKGKRLEVWAGAEQGFIDQFGNFLTREQAHVIAKENGQIKRRCGGDENKLFSENLY